MDKVLDFEKEVKIVNAIKDYVFHVQLSYNKVARDKVPDGVKVVPGRKFHKVIVEHANGSGSHVHAFVERATGDLYKAASWHQPAKGVRYNLIKDMVRLSREIDFAGAYLYKKGVR